MITSKEVNDFFIQRWWAKESPEGVITMKLAVFTCNNCGWVASAGDIIKCDSITDGPWYCPTCTLPLPEITLKEVKKEPEKEAL